MTYDQLNDKINEGAYENKVPYVSSRKDPAAWARYNAEEARLMGEFEEDCINYLTSTTDMPERTARKIFNKAWQDGHAYGLYEVFSELEELGEIFRG